MRLTTFVEASLPPLPQVSAATTDSATGCPTGCPVDSRMQTAGTLALVGTVTDGHRARISSAGAEITDEHRGRTSSASGGTLTDEHRGRISSDKVRWCTLADRHRLCPLTLGFMSGVHGIMGVMMGAASCQSPCGFGGGSLSEDLRRALEEGESGQPRLSPSSPCGTCGDIST